MSNTPTDRPLELATVLRQNLEPRTIDVVAPDGATAQMLLVPAAGGGLTLHAISTLVDPFRTAPVRRKGTAKVDDIDSFIAHALRFADKDSAIFVSGSASQPTFRAVLDYHRAGADAAPRFGEHRTEFTPVLSPEWAVWTKSNRSVMEHGELGEFIDSRLADLADPPEDLGKGLLADFRAATGISFATKAEIIGVSQEFVLRSDSEIRSIKNLATGQTQISYGENHVTDGSVPRAFVIAIPVFKLGALVRLPARLRWKKSGESVEWHYDLFEFERALEAEVADMIARVGKATGLPVLRGTAE